MYNFKDENRISVTILTGFLGSGKTTFLNYLIKNYSRNKIFIIENEFGEISIDTDLIVKENDGIFELSNGCLCCSLNDDLLKTLQKVAFHPAKPTHLVIETTGLADPAPIALSFVSDLNVQSLFRLDGIITLIDTVNISNTLPNEPIAAKQIAMADMLLLTKTDLSGASKVEEAINLCQKINPLAKWINKNSDEFDTIDWLNLNAFDAKKVLTTNFNAKPRKFSLAKSNTHNAPLLINENNHLHDITSHSFVLDAPLDVLKFDAWIRLMLNWGNGLFFRGKGILYIQGVDTKVIFQSVQNQFITEDGGLWGTETKQTRLVFIGKHLNKELLQKGLQACTVNGIEAYQDEFFVSVTSLQDKMYEHLKQQLNA